MQRLARYRRGWLFIIGMFAAFSVAIASAGEPTVTTIAGNGRAGTLDGAALSAEFMMPVALASSKDGSQIYIADAGAQRIRVLAHGSVTTIAGSGGTLIGGTRLSGGYADGPAASARFNLPMGIAVGPDGAIYVADEYNHCIRKIAGGVVSTFAGSPTRAGYDNGPRAVASFEYPDALTFDDAGNMYVADYGSSVRKIDTNGNVSALALYPSDTKFTGISAFGSGDNLVLYIANIDGLSIYRPQKGLSKFLPGAGEGYLPRHAHPYGVDALDANHALISDAEGNVVRLYRGIDENITEDSVYPIAGVATEDPDDSMGFRDGTLRDARFTEPTGAIVVGGNVIIADAGNRRIRSLPLESLRGPIGSRFQDLGSDQYYRIALVSNSMGFFHSEWSNSIGGLLESNLQKDAPNIGLHKDARVSVVRIDAGGITDTTSYIQQLLGDGEVDMVVLLLNYNHAFSELMDANPHNASVAIPDAEWTTLDRSLRGINDRLTASGEQFLVVTTPSRDSLSPLVYVGSREFAQGTDLDQIWQADQRLNEVVAATGVSHVSFLPQFVDYAQSDKTPPLFDPLDSHFSPAGNALVAQLLTAELERLRPWSGSVRR